jgi:hypothetical protein
MNKGVRVKGPGFDYPAELRDDRAECHYEQPVLVMDGQALGIAELPPGSRVKVVWKKARTGPVWNFIQGAINAGYPIELDLSHW